MTPKGGVLVKEDLVLLYAAETLSVVLRLQSVIVITGNDENENTLTNTDYTLCAVLVHLIHLVRCFGSFETQARVVKKCLRSAVGLVLLSRSLRGSSMSSMSTIWTSELRDMSAELSGASLFALFDLVSSLGGSVSVSSRDGLPGLDTTVERENTDKVDWQEARGRLCDVGRVAVVKSGIGAGAGASSSEVGPSGAGSSGSSDGGKEGEGKGGGA